MADIRIHKDRPALVSALVSAIHTMQVIAINERGRFTIALAGGSTPKDLYKYLAGVQSNYDWDKWHVFFGDERTVPPDSDDSNYYMARRSLLDAVPIPTNQIYRMQGEIEPQLAAENYVQTLRDVFADESIPRFDLILLGMGDDGHTASLFPYTAVVHETEKWVVAHYVNTFNIWRITLTPLIVNSAHNVIFMVTGDTKAERLNEVINGEYEPDRLPSQIIKPTDGQLKWYLDKAAARYLK